MGTSLMGAQTNQNTQTQINYNNLSIVKLIQLDYTLLKHSANTLRAAEHSSLVVWPETNSFSWFSQEISGGPTEWLKDVCGFSDEDISEICKDQSLFGTLSNNTTQTLARSYPLGKIVPNKYIQDRGVSFETQKHFGIEIYEDNILIPLYSPPTLLGADRIGSLIRRTDTNEGWLKYRKIITEEMCPLWPPSEISKRYEVDKVFVFEGAWSVMRWWQVAKNSSLAFVALLSTATSTATNYIYNIDNVIFVLDNDKNKAGLSVHNRIKETKNYNPAWKFILPSIYPDEMTDSQIKLMLEKYGI